jgi:DnaJ like chaperone protein
MWKVIFVIFVILYVLNPFDIVPDLFPGLGWFDDVFMVGLLWRYLAAHKPAAQRRSGTFQDRPGTGRRQQQAPPDGQGVDSSEWDPYRVLGIERKAGPEEIKSAYRRMVNQYHPDKVTHLGPEFKELAEKRFKEIQRAYQEIKPR